MNNNHNMKNFKNGYVFRTNQPTVILIIDPRDGSIVDANDGACNFYHYTKKEILRKNICDINTLPMEQIFKKIKEVNLEINNQFIFHHRLANGEIKKVKVHSGPIKINNQSLIYSIVNKVTEKHEFRELLRQSNRDIRQIFNKINDPIVLIEFDEINNFKCIIDVNNETCLRFGYTRKELLKISSSNLSKLFANIEEIGFFKINLFKKHNVTCDITFVTKNGKKMLTEVNCSLLQLYEKKIGILVIRDITERKKIEEKLKNAYLELNQIFNNTGDGMCIIDTDFNITSINSRLLDLLELNKDKVVGKKCYEIFPDFTCDTKNCPMIQLKKGKNQFIYEAEKNLTNKKIPFIITTTPLITSDNRISGIIQSYKDISRLKDHEKALMNAKIYAEEANNFKTQFLANMSHEIRTPMNGIIGIIDLLEDTNLSREQKEYVDTLKYSADRLLVIINDILDITKIEAGKIQVKNQSINTKNYFENTIKYFNLQAKRKNIKFFTSIDPTIPKKLMGDFNKLNKVLFNLLSNAIKFTEKGHISLEVRLVKQYDDNVELEFSIRDTGIGIQKNRLEDIFQSFTQIDVSNNRQYKGTGLGLTITKKLVEIMGGSIKVDSQYGKGSTFTVQLKFNFDESNKIINSISDNEDLDLNYQLPAGLRILLAEDDYINQKIIKKILEKNGWDVTEALNGMEVFEHLEEKSFDIILMDINMPKMDGYETTKLIREKENGEHIPIIAMTAAAMKQDKERCFKLGMDAYLSKPVKADSLNNTILSILKEKNNLKDIIEKFNGDKELLCEIIDDVISDEYQKQFIENMENHIKDKNFKKISDHAHKFMGSISYFGSLHILKLIDDIKRECKKRDLNRTQLIFNSLKKDFNDLKQNLIFYKTMLK